MKPELPIALVVVGAIVINECAGSHGYPHLEETPFKSSITEYVNIQTSSGSSPMQPVVSDATVNLEWT